MEDANGKLLTDSQHILNRWKNDFFQLMNMHNVSDVRQTEIPHTAEPLVPGPNYLEVETVLQS
jgi:hypothetical protein